MPLKVGQNQHGIVIYNILTHKILVYDLTAGDRQLQIRSFRIQKIHRKMLQPAVVGKELLMPRCGVAMALIRSIALHHRASDMIDHRLPEGRTQKVLIALFAGMHLHRHLAGQLLTQQAI